MLVRDFGAWEQPTPETAGEYDTFHSLSFLPVADSPVASIFRTAATTSATHSLATAPCESFNAVPTMYPSAVSL
jgi:hypothetical protein